MLEEKGKEADDIRFSDLNYDTLLDFFNWLETDRLCSQLPEIRDCLRFLHFLSMRRIEILMQHRFFEVP